MAPRWIVCQIGAREHYVLAAELHRRNLLSALFTDAWILPGSLESRLAGLLGAKGRQMRGRYTPALSSAPVVSDSVAAIIRRQLVYRVRRLSGWGTIISQNDRFAEKVSRQLSNSGALAEKQVVFAYSYAARRIFETAKEYGCMTVLGQIDPGPAEERLVTDISRLHGLNDGHISPPESYWENWRAECELADCIVVNSYWSRDMLIDSGVMSEKIHVIPLAYKASSEAEPSSKPRVYPAVFEHSRPLRLLYLGQVNIRKGVVELLYAMKSLIDEPVRLTIVGQPTRWIKDHFSYLPNVDWIGPAPRSEVGDHYRAADAFILPTHSDGFAITQLEAASYGLPLIVSPHCGEVVKDGVGGVLINRVDPKAIETAIRRALKPEVLGTLAVGVRNLLANFTPERVVDRLLALAEDKL